MKLFYIFGVIGMLSYAQTPCEEGMAGEFPCNDYDLMHHFDKTTLSSHDGSDVWGWTDPLDNKEYALATFEDKTCFLDITNPVAPIYLGYVNTSAGTNVWRDIKVYNNYAFIVADNVGAHGMQVFDLTRLRDVTNPPENFTPETILTEGWGGTTIESCHNIVINETVGMAYLVGCGSANGGGPIFIDISNPEAPVAVGEYTADGYSHDAQVVTYDGPDTDYTGHEILIGSNEDVVVIVDVTDPTNPVKISEVTYSNTSYTHQGWFSEDKNYFLVGDELDEIDFGGNTRTIIFDFSDLDNPTYHSEYVGNTTAIDHNLYTDNNTIYESNYTAGLRVLDMTDVNAITEVGYFDTHPENDDASFNGAWSVYPYFESGNIIINDINRGLFIVQKSGTLSVDDAILVSKNTKIYPNPSASEVLITAKNYTLNEVQLYTVLGQEVVRRESTYGNEIRLDVGNYDEGVYFLKINNQITKKIIIKR